MLDNIKVERNNFKIKRMAQDMSNGRISIRKQKARDLLKNFITLGNGHLKNL